MNVRCLKIVNTSGVVVSSSPWLTIGAVYPVLALFIADGEIKYLLAPADADVPGLFAASQFEIVDPRIPRNWVAAASEQHALKIGPPVFLNDAFWDRFNEGEKSARDEFLRTVSESLAAVGA